MEAIKAACPIHIRDEVYEVQEDAQG